MLLCRDLQSEGQVMHLIEDCSQNKKLWLKGTNIRDEGVITIGAYFDIPNPKAIKVFMADNIPLVITGDSINVPKNPTLPPYVRIETTITKIN